MISKNSFLASLKENNKRRLAIWILSLLAFALVQPILVSLAINNVVSRTDNLIKVYGAAAAEKIVYQNLLMMLKSVLGPGFPFSVMTTVIIAFFSAVQGFSWLYSRKKIDFYMGMPVKRSKRFLGIWLNGILIYLIPYFIGEVFSILIAAVNHGLNGRVFEIVVQTFGLSLLLYLCVYHLAIFTVMLTGNVVITGMGFAVFCLYEFVGRMLYDEYHRLFFRYYNVYNFDSSPLLSPFRMYAQIADFMSGASEENAVWIIWKMVMFAVIVGILAYLCYLKRPAEGAGRAMVFSFTKPIVKIGIVVLAALLTGLVAADLAGFEPKNGNDGIGYVILLMALAVVLGCAAIQAIFDFDIKGVLREKLHIIITGVITAVIFLVFQYDLFHYDAYIPNAEKVESVAFVPRGYEQVSGFYGGYVDSEGSMSEMEYAVKYMYLTDVEDVCQLAEISMEEYNKFEKNGYNMDTFEDEDTGSYWSGAAIVYRLKNGKEVYRNLWVNVEDERTKELLDHITGTAEFKEGYLMGASKQLDAVLDDPRYEMRAYYGNLVQQSRMSREELNELLECYRKDVEEFSFLKVKESMPAGAVMIELEEELSKDYYEGYTRTSSMKELGINIYPFYENCVSYLKEKGYYLEMQVELDDIAQVQVVNYNSEAAEKLRSQQGTAIEDEEAPMAVAETKYAGFANSTETSVYVDYTEEEKIEQIASLIYPREFISSRWDNGLTYDEEYEVVVYFKPGSEIVKEYGSSHYYCFLEGTVPQFVQEDTVYK